MNTNDTIAAIATGLTASGIGIIRISGPESYAVASKIFTRKDGSAPDFSKPNRIRYGYINVSRETLDEVLVMNMKAPHSYTGEDTVEINCHGGPLMMKRVLEAVLSAGARPAEPGEFTKRAFLNGRIDLAQAEAVIDVINAKNDDSIRASVSQLKGSVSKKVEELREKLIKSCAYIEAALDDPEHYDLTGYGSELLKDLTGVREEIRKLTDSYRSGRVIKEGIDTCILGKPNAGKSSLLNALLGEERAIVTEIPGTTRDAIRESITYDNITLNIVDTAGVRDTEDRVEAIGVQVAYRYAEAADLILYVIDASRPLDSSDRKIMDFIEKNQLKAIYLYNKSDLPVHPTLSANDVSRETLMISTKTGEGIDRLLKKIRDMFVDGSVRLNDQVVITSERHKDLLSQAETSVANAIVSIENELPEDFYTIDLMDAYRSLGMIIGKETEEDLVDRIFSEFCMGK